MPSVSIRNEWDRVLIIVDGKSVIDMPWNKAHDLAKAITSKAFSAEEIAKRDQVIFDQALLQRAGWRIGLTSHPDMLKEAGKEVAWNSDLRKYLPGNIGSQEQFGAPVVGQTPALRRNGDGP